MLCAQTGNLTSTFQVLTAVMKTLFTELINFVQAYVHVFFIRISDYINMCLIIKLNGTSETGKYVRKTFFYFERQEEAQTSVVVRWKE